MVEFRTRMMLGKRIQNVLSQKQNVIKSLTIISNLCTDNDIRTSVLKEVLSEYGVENESHINKLFRLNSYLDRVDLSVWKNFTGTLTGHGFKIKDCFQILVKYPPLLTKTQEQLEYTFREWKRCSNLELDLLLFLLLNKPEFLDIDIIVLQKRIPYLLSFAAGKESLVHLLLLCPSLLTENWGNILKKISFLNDEMIVHRTEVLQCRALSKSLKHIKLRFTILEKCGLYTKPNYYLHKQTKKERLMLMNPHLKRITDNSDLSFSKNIAHITLEEYQVFSKLFYKDENELSKLESDDSDDE